MADWQLSRIIAAAIIIIWSAISGPLAAQTVPAGNVTYTAPGTGGVAQTAQTKFQQYIYAEDFGADNTCSADAKTPLANAIAYAQSVNAVLRLRGCYRLASSLVVTGAVAIEGDAYGFQNPLGTYATQIKCDLAVTPCLQMGDGTVPWSQQLTNLTITRASGTPSTTAEGLVIWSNQVVLNNISISNHGVCIRLEESNQAGFAIMADKIFTGQCRAYHLDVNGWAEARFNQSRFGQNGPSAYGSTAYVRVRGGVANTAGGPNSLTFINTQFNQGDINYCPSYFIDFVNLGSPGANVDTGGNSILGSHIECVGTAIFHSDASWTQIKSWKIIGSTFNTPSTPFWALNPATGLLNWQLIGNELQISNFNLAPTGSYGIQYFNWVGGRALGPTHITATPGADNQMTVEGVIHGGNVVYDGFWNNLNSLGEMNTFGGFNYANATGNVSVIGGGAHAITAAQASGTPTISCPGATGSSVDGRSRDNAGGFYTGTSGTISSCSITYSQGFPNMSWPVVIATSPGAPAVYVGATKTGFTVNFASNAVNSTWVWLVTGQ